MKSAVNSTAAKQPSSIPPTGATKYSVREDWCCQINILADGLRDYSWRLVSEHESYDQNHEDIDMFPRLVATELDMLVDKITAQINELEKRLAVQS